MNKIIVHQPKNFESRYYRYYNIFFDKFIDYLRTKFDVIDARYYKYANMKHYPALLLSQDTFYNDTNIQMLECEMIIENYETKEIKVLSVSDDLTSSILSLQDSPYLSKVLVSQFDRNRIFHHVYNDENKIKYNPWVYFPQNLHDFDTYYNKRKELNEFIDKFYFRGTSIECRKIITYFDSTLFEGGLPIGGFETYANDLIQYKLGFSIAGRGEFCYRDVEYMAMGVPFIRFKFNSEMDPKLIPNYHYISVDRPEDLDHDRNSTEAHAKLIEKRFLEVKDDIDFLKFISKNARAYYENFITFDNCTKHTYKLLDLDKWLVQQ